METWKKLLLAAGGAAGVTAVIYYLRKEESSTGREVLASGDAKKKKTGVSVEEITKEQVQQMLQEVIKSQGQLKACVRELRQELLREQLTFEQVHGRVKAVQPADPLERYGLSTADFDQLLERHQGDPSVREAIAKIMGGPSPSSCVSEKVQSISVKTVVDVHGFLLEQLEKLRSEFQALPSRAPYDAKTVAIAAQAIVGSKMEQAFGVTVEDVESAVQACHTALAKLPEFVSINNGIQRAMDKLMGALL